MALHTIKHRFTGLVLFELECGSLKLCLEAAVKSGAYLGDANLGGANLRGATLGGAYLRGANLGGATYGDGIPITKQPVQVFGLSWPVLILDAHMEIGCELHSLADWADFDNERIAQMDGTGARRFWTANKEPLLAGITAASIHGMVATGVRAGRRLRRDDHRTNRPQDVLQKGLYQRGDADPCESLYLRINVRNSG